jgi:hypothetical protein
MLGPPINDIAHEAHAIVANTHCSSALRAVSAHRTVTSRTRKVPVDQDEVEEAPFGGEEVCGGEMVGLGR